MEWTPKQYRAAYHFSRFTQGWRQLVVFYVAMALAGYAQSMHSFIFYAAWGALVLMYWEPYLAPQSPSPSDSPFKTGLDALLSLKLNSGAIDAEELATIKQYVLGIQRGLNETQLRVYKVVFGAIIAPYICLVVGVVQQASRPEYSCERQIVYASCVLLALMTVYTFSVGVCLSIIHCVQQQESKESRTHEVDWQPHDMMFFMCKILGEVVNTVVQTLIAGSFMAYMPWHVFWLCICITGLTYTATNLLYGFGDRPPIQDTPPDWCWLRLIRAVTPEPHHQSAGLDTMPSADESTKLPSFFSAPAYLAQNGHNDVGGTHRQGGVGPGGAATVYVPPRKHSICDLGAVAASAIEANPGQSFKDVNLEATTAVAECKPRLWHSFNAVLLSMKKGKLKRPPSPPFLMYKWPKGLRGWSIIGLLLVVAVPSTILLAVVGRGIASGNPDLILEDTKNDCRGKACYERYKQLLLILGCLGCLISYYAFSIGFLGAGPVTWLYRVVYMKSASRQHQALLCRESSG